MEAILLPDPHPNSGPTMPAQLQEPAQRVYTLPEGAVYGTRPQPADTIDHISPPADDSDPGVNLNRMTANLSWESKDIHRILGSRSTMTGFVPIVI